MRKVLLGLALVGAISAAVWFGVLREDAEGALADESTERAAYDFEAQGVLLRQLDAKGRLQYEVEAERIVQLPDAGPIEASGLTLHYWVDSPGAPRRWTATASEGVLPADAKQVTLTGQVRASGTLPGRELPVQVDTAELLIDMENQVVSAEGEVQARINCNSLQGRNLRVDISAGTVALKSDVHGSFRSCR